MPTRIDTVFWGTSAWPIFRRDDGTYEVVTSKGDRIGPFETDHDVRAAIDLEAARKGMLGWVQTLVPRDYNSDPEIRGDHLASTTAPEAIKAKLKTGGL